MNMQFEIVSVYDKTRTIHNAPPLCSQQHRTLWNGTNNDGALTNPTKLNMSITTITAAHIGNIGNPMRNDFNTACNHCGHHCYLSISNLLWKS